MEYSPNQSAGTELSSIDTSVKQETNELAACSQQTSLPLTDHITDGIDNASDSNLVKMEKTSETRTSCEAMDTNNNNNALDEDQEKSSGKERNISQETSAGNENVQAVKMEGDSLTKLSCESNSATLRDLRAKQAGNVRMRNFGLSQGGLVTPEFQSRTETPTSASQLLNLPSSALFALEGLEFNTPIGSGQFSPLASARIGRKRQLSVSPLSSSSIDLNSLIRTSPTSLVNYITNSRSSSAGSIGHLSPSFFSKPSRFQTPLGRPLQVSLRNTGYPLPNASDSTLDQNSKPNDAATAGNVANLQTAIKEENNEESFISCHNPIAVSLPEIKMERDSLLMSRDTATHQVSTLETVREESVGALGSSDDEGHHTDITDYSSALNETESELDSKKGILDSKNKRVYYNYPSVEDPHNNQCKWADCNHQCDKLESLVQHVNNEHIYRDSRKEFICYWNGCVREKKPFKAQYMLLVHMRRHTGEKPHKCTYEGCNKAYSRLENLKTHLRSHTGERPYVCKVEGCLKAFSNASDCAKHMNRTHTDEKPYACPNPGCSKRYTDPSSRRKHVKNCQVNKKARTGDPDAMSGAEEENSTEPTGGKSNSNKKTTKLRKSEKRKSNGPSSMPATNSHSFTAHAQPALSDHGYFSGGSQGYNSSQLSYNSMPEGDSEYPKLRGDEEISHILQQQRLSDPNDAATSMQQSNIGMVMSSQIGVAGDHMSDHMPPNVRASRQNGGGLTLPAGSIHPTPPHSHFQHIQSPSYPSSHSGYSHLPLHHSNQPPNNPQTTRTSSLASSQHNPYSNGRHNHTTYSFRSYSPPKAGITGSRKSPSDDSSVVSSSLRSSIMTNSYSTFSSNSSRVSSPCSNSGRSEMLRPHPPVSPRFNQTGFANTSLHAQVNRLEGDFPLKQAVKMTHNFSPREPYMRRQNSDTRSERSWQYSSQSSRYSFSGSELSDDLLDSLPSSTRRHSFTKKQPLPFPESMQDDFIGMECGHETIGDQNGFMDLLPSQQCDPAESAFLSQIQSDHLGQSNSDPLPSTLPLHHIDSSNEMDIADVNSFSNHVSFQTGLFSQEAPNDEYDLIFNDLPYTASTSNMMVGDMSSFATTLPEETQYLEQLLSSRVK